jgi:pimeloyl-ACP methyl ester carboxylesterase
VHHVELAGLRVSYRRAGAGPAVVLLHGGLADSREWGRQTPALSGWFDVVAWDAPGCGRSADPPPGFRLPDYADCLAGLVDALGLGRAHVVGLSFGAGLALELFRRHPRLPASLVLASAYAGWAGSLPPHVVEARLEGALRDADRSPAELVAGWLPTLFSPSAPREVVDDVATMMADFQPAGVRAMARSFAEADLRDVLPRVDVPTLLLHGEADVRAPLDVADALHAAIPGSRLVVIPGVGHQLNAEAPERFNAEVLTFLRSVAA